MGQIIYSSTEPRFPDTGKVTRDKILQAIVGGAGQGGGAAVPYTAEMLLDFEAGIHGATIDATYMNANDKGTPPNLWTITATAPTVSTVNAKQLTTPVIVGGVTYDTVGGTRSMESTHATAGNIATQWSGGARINDVAIGCWWKTTVPNPDQSNGGFPGTYDLLKTEHEFGPSSEWSVMQLENFELSAHSSCGNGSGIAIVRDTWYWVVLVDKKGYGSHVYVYNEDGTLRGESFIAFGCNANTLSVRHIVIGNPVPHGAFPTGSEFFDNIVIRWGPSATTSVTHPFGP